MEKFFKNIGDFLERRIKTYSERVKKTEKSLGGPELPEATVWGGRDYGYWQGIREGYEAVKDWIEEYIEKNEINENCEKYGLIVKFLEAQLKDENEILERKKEFKQSPLEQQYKIEQLEFIIKVVKGTHPIIKLDNFKDIDLNSKIPD